MCELETDNAVPVNHLAIQQFKIYQHHRYKSLLAYWDNQGVLLLPAWATQHKDM